MVWKDVGSVCAGSLLSDRSPAARGEGCSPRKVSAELSAPRKAGSLWLQNHRIVGVGRDLCGSSSPPLLPKQGHLQQAAQDLVQAGSPYLVWQSGRGGGRVLRNLLILHLLQVILEGGEGRLVNPFLCLNGLQWLFSSPSPHFF